MNEHPYAPLIIAVLAVAFLAGLSIIVYLIRADRRDTRRLAWDKAHADHERQQRERAALAEDLALADLINTEQP